MPFVEHGLLVELVDIADSETWVAQYGLRIPVLRRCDNGAEQTGHSRPSRWPPSSLIEAGLIRANRSAFGNPAFYAQTGRYPLLFP